MPLEVITGARIAECAEVGYATFFRHYADVRALLVDTVAAVTDDLALAMMPALLAADSGGAAVALVDAVAARRAVFRSLLAGAGDALRAKLARQVIERIAALPDVSPSWRPRRLATRVAVMGRSNCWTGGSAKSLSAALWWSPRCWIGSSSPG